MQQVFRVDRHRTVKGKITVEVAYGVTSLDRTQVDAQRLLHLVREHWGIENRVFHVRDVTLGEDACRVRRGAASHVLAALRNLTLGLMERAGWSNKAQAARHYAAKPLRAVRLLNLAKN